MKWRIIFVIGLILLLPCVAIALLCGAISFIPASIWWVITGYPIRKIVLIVANWVAYTCDEIERKVFNY